MTRSLAPAPRVVTLAAFVCLGLPLSNAHAAPGNLYDPTSGSATVDGAITAAGFTCVAGTGCTPTEYDQQRLYTVGVGASFVCSGFSPRNIGALDLPTIWMLPMGYAKSLLPK